MDTGSLDPQQIFQWQSIAAFFQRQHHFAHPQIFNMALEVVDGAAGNRLFHYRIALVHANKADDDKARLAPLCPRASAQHQHPAPER